MGAAGLGLARGQHVHGGQCARSIGGCPALPPLARAAGGAVGEPATARSARQRDACAQTLQVHACDVAASHIQHRAAGPSWACDARGHLALAAAAMPRAAAAPLAPLSAAHARAHARPAAAETIAKIKARTAEIMASEEVQAKIKAQADVQRGRKLPDWHKARPAPPAHRPACDPHSPPELLPHVPWPLLAIARSVAADALRPAAPGGSRECGHDALAPS